MDRQELINVFTPETPIAPGTELIGFQGALVAPTPNGVDMDIEDRCDLAGGKHGCHRRPIWLYHAELTFLNLTICN
jgi:hypothetical protein